MKFLRFVGTVALLLFCIQTLHAQKYRFKASSLSVMDRGEKGQWSEWSEFKPADVVITLDGDKDRIVIHSKDIQLYRITAYYDKIETEKEQTLGFECLDNTGEMCVVLLVTHKDEGGRMQFYINYRDLKMVYNVYNAK
ncbi:hypothetical protein [Flavobacterium stagni]|uniref:Uncharacterized protein n=1 Tax=Flavobacterium stagni TaxID=2506421 RepID=A0A4Q1KCY9_9FLAO|nr:hypothetical protein [Flavobacterium stagni]RXR24304.1 hypothetical protein EQG61_02345 [Flavobacterium stagni]